MNPTPIQYVSRAQRPLLEGLIYDIYFLVGTSTYARLRLPPAPYGQLSLNQSPLFRVRFRSDTSQPHR